jgi:hypothetical protein
MRSLKDKEFSSIRAAARHFQIPPSTLIDRMSGAQSQVKSHETYQTLSNAEENTLVRWITRLTATGYPATPALLREMAQEVWNQRVHVASRQTNTPSSTTVTGHEWLYRFLNRHPNLKATYSRQLESARHKEATSERISAWFDAFHTRVQERKYLPCNIYNMDEKGFAVGGTQSTRIIVDSAQKSNWKVTAGRQEWITVLECIDGAGGALPPMIIFKAQNTNSAWIPQDTPCNGHVSRTRDPVV